MRLLNVSKLVVSLFLAIVFCASADTLAQSKPNVTVKVPYKTRSYVGKPLAWDGKDMMLLRRDGKISVLPVKSDEGYRKVKSGFDPYSASELRAQLQREFGSKYQVSLTNNFVVVHPPGDYGVWAMPFQELYSRFRSYFSSRGMRLEEPEFPMVAVVLRTRGEFDRMLRSYHDYDSNVLGYYNPRSNRIITYNQGKGKSSSKDWFFNTDTVIHEATHQTAFNTGIHSRFAPVPRWISEGLAMLFEAKGINNSMFYAREKDRINRERLIALQHYYKRGAVKGKLTSLIVSDDLFRSDPQLAYALSWGVTFFLSEKMPSAYQNFLRKDGNRSEFQEFSRKQRASAFAREFGKDFNGLESRMKRFIENLKVPKK